MRWADSGHTSYKRWAWLMALSLMSHPILLVSHTYPAIAQAQTVPTAVREGYTFLSRGWIDRAITTFQAALSRYPQSLEAKIGLAIAYRRAGQIEAAWDTYNEALQQDPNNALVLKTIGLLGSYQPEWQQRGIVALTTLLNQTPNDDEARAQRALLYFYEGDFNAAIADYRQVLPNNPSPEVLLNAAQVYTYANDPQTGLGLFERYQALGTPITGNAILAYGRALRETGRSAESVQVFERALQQSQSGLNLTLVRSELAQSYIANQQPNQALAALEPLRGQPEATLALARALNEIGSLTDNLALRQEAAALYRQELEQDLTPSFSLRQEVAAVLSLIPQEQPYALQLYRQLVREQPDQTALVVRQLALENSLGLISAADLRQQLQGTLSRLPTEANQRADIAQALIQIDPPPPELLSVYESLLQAGVEAPFLNFRIAQIYVAQGDIASAQTALARYQATATGATDLAPELLLAEIEQRSGDLDASSQRYQAILARSAVEPSIRNAAQIGLVNLAVVQDRRLEALQRLEQLQLQAQGTPNPAIARQRQQIQEDFLRRRGFQPPWERY